MEAHERIWAQSSDNTTRFGTWDDHRPHSDCVEYIRADLAIQIPPEGPDRDDLVEHLTDVIFDSAAEGDERPTWSTAQAAAKAALAALIGEK